MFTRITACVSQLPQLKARNADTMHQVNTSARSTFFIAAKSSVQPQEVIHSKKSQKKACAWYISNGTIFYLSLIMYRNVQDMWKTPAGLKLQKVIVSSSQAHHFATGQEIGTCRGAAEMPSSPAASTAARAPQRISRLSHLTWIFRSF